MSAVPSPASQPNEDAYRFAFAQVQAGVRPFDVQRQLVARGWDVQIAAQVMNHVRRVVEGQGTSALTPSITHPPAISPSGMGSPPGASHGQPYSQPQVPRHQPPGQPYAAGTGPNYAGQLASQVPPYQPPIPPPFPGEPVAPFSGDPASRAVPVPHSQGNGQPGKIPWAAYRDLLVGGIFLVVAVGFGSLGHSIAAFFALLFAIIQLIRAIAVAILSRYRL